VVTREHGVQLSRIIPGARLIILPGSHGAYLGSEDSGNNHDNLAETTAKLVGVFLND
jgi:hypothetical protein